MKSPFVYFAYTYDMKCEGIPHCKVLEYKEYKTWGRRFNGWDLNSKSILAMYGYNLSSGLSMNERQDVLRMVMDKGIMSWNQIIEHLEFLINTHGMMGHDQAVDTWYEDIDFVYSYRRMRSKKWNCAS